MAPVPHQNKFWARADQGEDDLYPHTPTQGFQQNLFSGAVGQLSLSVLIKPQTHAQHSIDIKSWFEYHQNDQCQKIITFRANDYSLIAAIFASLILCFPISDILSSWSLHFFLFRDVRHVHFRNKHWYWYWFLWSWPQLLLPRTLCFTLCLLLVKSKIFHKYMSCLICLFVCLSACSHTTGHFTSIVTIFFPCKSLSTIGR